MEDAGHSETGLLYRQIAPDPRLAPYVSRFYSISSCDVRLSELASIEAPGAGGAAVFSNRDPLLTRLLPNGDSNIIFDLGAPGGWSPPGPRRNVRDRTLALGAVTRPLRIRFGDGVELLGVAFAIGRSRPFLPAAAHLLTDRIVRLSELWGDRSAALEARLRRRSSMEDRVRCLETELLEHLPRRWRSNGDLDATVHHIARQHGDVRVGSLCPAGGPTRQHLARMFHREVGVSPKVLARLTRFHALLDRVLRHREPDWAGLAPELGYYDQAHMIAEFRRFTELPPGRFFRRRQRQLSGLGQAARRA